MGTALIEIVVTIGFIVIALFGYFAALRTVFLTRVIKRQSLAQQVAIKKMEELKVTPFASLPVSGPFTDPALVALPEAQGFLTLADYDGNAALKEATVIVTWQEGGDLKKAELKTLITPGGI